MKHTILGKMLLFESVRADEAVLAAAELNAEYLNKAEVQKLSTGYYELQRLLLNNEEAGLGNRWQNHIAALVATDENPFSLAAEKGLCDESLLKLAEREISLLREILNKDWMGIAEALGDTTSCVAAMPGGRDGSRQDKVLEILQSGGNDAATRLKEHYKKYGCGVFGQYDAFMWEGGLMGIEDYDPITFDDLVGYDIQKNKVLENAAFFMKGLPFNNMLLYGDRGTGKSSCVKALLNKYKEDGLRMVSLSKDRIGEMPELMEALSDRGCKFIVFIDDLSFEEHEMEYKTFKSAVEGNIRAGNSNIMICITSNRRNIIKSVWKDRQGQDDVDLNDALQEKRSLADRFGLLVTFSAPSKAEYLAIVENMASKEKLSMDADRLNELALQWELRGGGRSGRTARQFINQITAESKYNVARD